MEVQRFDALTSALARSSTRREALLHLARFVAAGVIAYLGIGCGSDEEVAGPGAGADEPEPEGTRVSSATPQELQSLQAAAAGNERYAALREYFENFRYTAGAAAAMMVSRSGAEETGALLVPYQPPEGDEPAYLAFGTNAAGESVAFALQYETANEIALGFHRHPRRGIGVEVIDLRRLRASRPASTSGQVHASSVTARNAPAVAATSPANITVSAASADIPASAATAANVPAACTVCMDTCNKGIKVQQAHCAVVALTAAIDAGLAGRRALKAAVGAIDTIGEMLDMSGDLGSMWGSASDIGDCSNPMDLDCRAEGTMCRDLCVGCDPGNSASCGGGANVCIGGDCRMICQGHLCGPLETCGSEGCVPTGIGADCEGIYMDQYRFGRGMAHYCCAFVGANCGPLPNGLWGGCCPTPSSVCISVGASRPVYGCCLLGGPDPRC